MKRLKPEVDIVMDLLKEVAAANPGNSFAQSILIQYQERGGLSKKQLQGLYGKAERLLWKRLFFEKMKRPDRQSRK